MIIAKGKNPNYKVQYDTEQRGIFKSESTDLLPFNKPNMKTIKVYTIIICNSYLWNISSLNLDFILI